MNICSLVQCLREAAVSCFELKSRFAPTSTLPSSTPVPARSLMLEAAVNNTAIYPNISVPCLPLLEPMPKPVELAGQKAYFLVKFGLRERDYGALTAAL